MISDIEKYGKSDEEKDMSKIIECREITRKIIEYGVSERQKYQIIKLLSLEIENRDNMIDIVKICDRHLQNENICKNTNKLISI